MPEPTRVTAVVVTWNRRDLLIEALDAIAAQTVPPQRIIVVDNASTDGTGEALLAYPGVEVLTTSENIGGAGGFALGLRAALAGACDAVWLMDDDTVPEPTALAALVEAWREYASGTGPRPALVASKVVWTDGRDHPMNTPRPRPGAGGEARARAAQVGCVPVRTASFVSILVDATRARQVELPVADYFIWNDDFEYTARLVRGGVGLYCPASVVVHKTARVARADDDPGERFFHEVRNKTWLFTRSRGLAPWEKALYAGATARRWSTVMAHSGDKATLRSAARRGLTAGLRTAPADTEETLRRAWPGPGTSPQSGPGEGSPRPFSVLMCCYERDQPAYLAAAWRSVTSEQTRPPDELVLVQDGPVPAALAATIEELIAGSTVPVHHVVLARNGGLGPALNAGLVRCSHDIVARMDADDLSVPRRFEVQLPLIEAGLDVVGSALTEFATGPGGREKVRPVKVTSEEIRRGMRFRQTLNHPSVVYRASMVRSVGGYEDVPGMEDYLLFARLVQAGARMGNVAEPLLRYRVDDGAYGRRGGARMFRTELRLQREFRRMGFTSPGEYARNVAVRSVYRLVPQELRRRAYRRLFVRG